MRSSARGQASSWAWALSAACGMLVATGGCAPDFRSASELDESNQVLAVRATPPEIPQGGTVTLDALVHWPEGSPTLFWLVCVPEVGDTFLSCLSSRLESAADVPLCGQNPADRLCLAGVGESVGYTLPTGMFPADGKDHTFFVNLLAAGSDMLACGEVLTGGAPTPDCLLALKRVKVTGDASAPNQNPLLSSFLFNGAPLDPAVVETIDATEPDENDIRLEIAVTAEATSVDELGQQAGGVESFDLVVSFFTTCGRVSSDRIFLPCALSGPGGEPLCEPAKVFWRPEARGLCTLHAVVRDGEGGLGWLSQQVELR